MNIVERFEIPYFQYLTPNNQLTEDAAALTLPHSELLSIYRYMVLVRMMDAKAIALQRTGKIGTYPSTRGQEAVFVGIGHALKKSDIFVPYYRDIGTLIQRGVSLSQILLYWGGDERGNVYTDSEDFPFSVPVGSQPLHAAGAAFAVNYFNEDRAVLVTLGDGATSQGNFYEAMNVAGVWQLPLVFVICNNYWAISVPRSKQTAAKTLAQKAIAAGILGEQIDGNDIIAVVERTRAALERARLQKMPTVLEMICYRQHDHTTADDASRYEPSELRALEWKKEPIERLKKYLMHLEIWTEAQEKQLQKTCQEEIEIAVTDYLNKAPEPATAMFDYLYEVLPNFYESQRQLLRDNHE